MFNRDKLFASIKSQPSHGQNTWGKQETTWKKEKLGEKKSVNKIQSEYFDFGVKMKDRDLLTVFF